MEIINEDIYTIITGVKLIVVAAVMTIITWQR
jgi:hypothetical protein